MTRAMGYSLLQWFGGSRWDALLGVLAQHLLGLGGVALDHHGVTLEATGARARLVLVEVHLARLAVHDLARTRDLEPLLGTGVRLHLRHAAAPFPWPRLTAQS